MIDTSAFQNKTVRTATLGCKLNFAETAAFSRMLQEMGINTAPEGVPADICLVNTCAVTETAEGKCRQAIRRLRRENPEALMIVTGCYAQMEAKRLSHMEGVDLVLGTEEKGRIGDFLTEAWAARAEGCAQHHLYAGSRKDIHSFVPSCSRGNRTRYFLKVQDGCDYFCTYCTIPFARGRSRNPSIDSLVAQACQAAHEGAKEIVLTGVNIGDFGKTTHERFIDLIRALDTTEGISRYRISSLEPDLLDDSLINFCAHSRAFMPHFHLPLQSGSDAVLKLMHRRYDTTMFARKVNLIKEQIPDAFIGVDVMVGCRGETPAYFEACYDYLRQLDVTQLHVFPYSERPGTAALRIPYIVDEREKRLRARRLLDLSKLKTEDFYRRHIGQQAEVLFERAAQGHAMHGFTRNYIRVELPSEQAMPEYDNRLMEVTLGDFNDNHTALKAIL